MKKLVGEGKPFHSAVDKTAALLKRKSGTGAEFMKELMGVSGVKPTELQERGLTEIMGMPKMTHDQFMAALGSKPAPAVRELTFSEKPEPLSMEELRREANNVIRERASEYADEGADTSGEYRRLAADEMRRLRSNHMSQALRIAQENHLENFTLPFHETWTLPGGENYREMLIKSPEESGEIFGGRPGHFGGEPGILASMRLKDRTGPNGEKLLHLEELQSDWHQQGRDKGYKDPDAEQKLKQKDELKDTYEKLNKRRYELLNLARREPDHSPEFQSMIDEANGITPKLLALNSQMHDLEHFKRKQQDAVPDAPFKKNWEEMALKRLIHHAAEKGYHGVVVTPGVEQAKRYNIGDRIGYLGYHPEEERLKAYGHDRLEVMNQTGIKKEDLPSHIGKEVADRLLKAPQVLGTHQLEGEDIHVGGKGMKGFYDTKVPNILNSIGKKYGVKTQLGGHRLQGSPEDYSNAVEKLGIAHIPMAQLTPEQNQKIAETADKRLHHFPITEEMRKDVLTNGLPLYNKGGTVHMADGGDMDTMQMELMNKKMSGGGSFTTKGYVTHEPQKPHPEVGTRFKATPQGNLSQMQNFDLMKHEGKGSIVPIPYDATTRDNLVTEVSGHNLINPLLTEAGFDYSLDPTHMAQNIGGASSRGISRRVQRRVDQAGREHEGDVFLVPNTMSEDAENFSHHPAHIVLDLMAQRQLKNHTLQALSDDLRGQPELKRNAKTGITIKTYPYTNFLGYDHPNMMDQVMKGGHGLGTSAGNLRKKMMERLSLVKMQKLLDYNMGDLKASILDPDIATDPKAYMGRTFVKAQRGAALRPGSHGSYDTNYTGTNVGGLGANRPLEILMPDVTESIYKELNARPAKTVKTPAQMRAQVVGALEKRKENFSQPINARVINNAGLYEQGLKQGEFDPKNVESVLAYFRRKGGYKKGGKIKKMADGGQVDVQSIGVNEAPNMDVKAYFPPRPAQGSMLPVGGIQQAQQAPMQPPPPMPNQPQQQPSPAPIQVGQPPSNILQMTPQGQAMNAIKPPQMARGGKVDRDTMMLALMNRNKKVKYG